MGAQAVLAREKSELGAMEGGVQSVEREVCALRDAVDAAAARAGSEVELAFDALFSVLSDRKDALLQQIEAVRAERAGELGEMGTQLGQLRGMCTTAGGFITVALQEASHQELLSLLPAMTARAQDLKATPFLSKQDLESYDLSLSVDLSSVPAILSSLSTIGSLTANVQQPPPSPSHNPYNSIPPASPAPPAPPAPPTQSSSSHSSTSTSFSFPTSSSPPPPHPSNDSTTLVPVQSTRRKVDVLFPISIWGSYGRGAEMLRRPGGVVRDSKTGQFLVADTGNSRVLVFDQYGKGVSTLPTADPTTGETKLISPSSLALMSTKDGDEVWVSDGGLNVIVRIHRGSGAILGHVGRPGKGQGELQSPHGVYAVRDGSGLVAVADSGNGRIVIYDGKGNFIHALSGNKPEGTALKQPFDVLVLEPGEVVGTSAAQGAAVLVSDLGTGRVVAMGLDGSAHALQSVLSSLEVVSPAGLEFLPPATLLITDYTNHSVTTLDLRTHASVSFGGHGSDRGLFINPIDVAVGAVEDNPEQPQIVVVDHNNHRLQVFRVVHHL